MNTCATCKWHEKKVGNDPEAKNGAECVYEKLYEGGYGESSYQRDALVYSYMEGGWFWTGDDFGCVHHEPSNAANEAPDSADKGRQLAHPK